MGFLFTIFYQPVANILFALMSIVNTNNIVFGILALVVVMKLALLPLSLKNSKTQKKISGISEKLKDIKENIEDKKEQMEKTLQVYKEAGVNPLSPIVLLIIQIPFFFTVFFVTRDLGDGLFNYEEVLYSFIQKPEFVDFSFLSMNTAENGGIILAILITVSQIILMRQSQKKGVESPKNVKTVMLILPFIVGLLSLTIVATVGLYWFFNNLISILQESFIKRDEKGVGKEEDADSKNGDEEVAEVEKEQNRDKD